MAEAMLQRAARKQDSPFDYIIVGSGAGGGPLACRLASARKRVLLIEAGPDPKIAGEVHDAPLFHAASTEHPDLSWQFSVRHYANSDRQRQDQKYNPLHDDAAGTGGIFYPRSSGLGGCTSHHAMIVIRPNDADWDSIADLTNDDSWRAQNMQPYFAKFEECLYLETYRGFLAATFGWLYRAWIAVQSLANPKLLLDEGGHGRQGWQPTSFIAPQLIKRIIETDAELTKVLIESAFKVIENRHGLTAFLQRVLLELGLTRSFDPNDASTRAANPDGGVFLIPTGIGDGNSKLTDESGGSIKGRRAGLREFILETEKRCPEHLFIAQGVQVTEVLFAEDANLKIPRAIGVRGFLGDYLYRASPKCQTRAGKPVEIFLRHEERDDSTGTSRTSTEGEVILCGGAFNTPQLLMLSGIGDQHQIDEINGQAAPDQKITKRVHLPGVGCNLQDRYEVGVLSELKTPFKSLDSVDFKPGDPNDHVQAEWLKDREGLYATNGGTLAIIHRSKSAADAPDPDLFTFGAPAAFRGYYWGWSAELLKAVKGGGTDQRNLWTWVILKAYTRNNGGTVQLRSANPYDTPKICFHSFDEGGVPGWQKDLNALVDAVRQVQAINREPGSPFVRELQPEQYLAEKNEQRRKANLPAWTLEDWIKNEAWGHHACGTCRIGSDHWQKDAASLKDKGAVVDSHFRVHGVAGLRVVDASVFPKIPGYFILAPIFMVSEKAAATILTDDWEENFPGEVRAIEEQAIRARRSRALVDHQNAAGPQHAAPSPADAKAQANAGAKPQPVEHIVGLAFSGGGIRSATFSLGVLQAIAQTGRLRHIDYLSSVSGGGFTAGFLGRLFTRERVGGVADPCGRAQEILVNNKSGPLSWLRTQANYLFDAGASDWLIVLGNFFRSLFTVYLVVGVLLFAVFGTLTGISHLACYQRWAPEPPAALSRLPVALSPWWWVPVAVAGLVILPMMLAFWLAPKPLSYRSVSPYPFAAWLIVLAGSAIALVRPGGVVYAGPTLVVLALAWFWQEAARQSVPGDTGDDFTVEGQAVRNRLSRGVGEALILFAIALAWVVLDSLAGKSAHIAALPKVMAGLAVLAPIMQLFRPLAMKLLQGRTSLPVSLLINAIGVILALGLLYALDFAAHCLLETAAVWEHYVFIIVAFLFSAAIGPAFDFLNYSSLQAYYAAHITRTFLGASNESRTTRNDVLAANVQTVLPEDDLPHFQYRPETNGGPLHLISVCLNETVDQASQREIRDRKGLLMTIGSFGVSVGRRFFATWAKPCGIPRWMKFRLCIEGSHSVPPRPPALQAIRLNADPGTFHPLARRDLQPAVVKTLSLGDWLGISGAAFSTGRGRATSPLNALFMGLLNLRLGFWWHSGIQAGERPGRYPPNLWQRFKRLPLYLFHMQSLLLSEWRGRFDGPSRELWNLTDGGEQDNTALYELIRRRVPFIIGVDAGEDPNYTFGDLATLERLVRVDFGVEIEWLTSPQSATLPKFVQQWVNLQKVVPMNSIKAGRPPAPGAAYAALGRIKYQTCPQHPDGWLLLIKPSLVDGESLDLVQYAAEHPAFPQDSTFEQAYDDDQWESYRKLGYTAGMTVLR
jgi:choline dehydrogenase-like flavoprotein